MHVLVAQVPKSIHKRRLKCKVFKAEAVERFQEVQEISNLLIESDYILLSHLQNSKFSTQYQKKGQERGAK